MTSRGKIQRIKCPDVSTIGRNTQGVRIMGLDEDDRLAAVVRVPRDESDNGDSDNGDSENGQADDDGPAAGPESEIQQEPEATDNSADASDD